MHTRHHARACPDTKR
jgi:hypothetical protein